MSSGPYVHLSDSGQVSYGCLNGPVYTFDPLYKSKLTARARWDEAEKTITCWEFTLHVEAKVAPAVGSPISTGVNLNNAMADIMHTLMEPGGKLTYLSKGWDFQVNTGQGPKAYDAIWGPKPRVVEFMPLGNSNAANVTWECQFALPVCCQSPIYENALMAFNFEQSWSFDETGALELSVTGYLEIPLSRRPGTVIPTDWADKYRTRVYTDPPLGMVPKKRVFTQSKDQRRLNFSLTFQQVYAPLPNGCARARAREDLDSSLIPDGWHIWHGSISASFTVPPGTPKAVTMGYFGLLLQRSIKNFDVIDGAVAAAGANAVKPTILMDKFGLGNDLFEGTVEYRCQYRILGADIKFVLGSSGLWNPVPGTDFQSWKTSMSLPWGARGVSGATFSPSQAAIVDLCPDKVAISFRTGSLPDTTVLKPGSFPDSGSGLLNPSKTWIAFDNRLEVLTDERMAVHKPLVGRTLKAAPVLPGDPYGGTPGESSGTPPPGTGPAGPYPGLPLGGGAIINNVQSGPGGGGLPGGGATLNNTSAAGTVGPLGILQAVGMPTWRIRMRGYGVRVGFPVPDPELTEVGGVPAIPEKRWAQTGTAGRAGPFSIFTTVWDKVYLVTGFPTELPAPPNPIYDV